MASLYLLHIDPPYHHARHYLGFAEADDPSERVRQHLNGHAKGNPLVRAAVAAGHTVEHVLTIPGASRTFERAIKNRRNTPRLCPVCRKLAGMRSVHHPIVAEACL